MGYFTTQLDVPYPPDAPPTAIEVVRTALDELHAKGQRFVALIEFPQPLPNPTQYLLITDDGVSEAKVERRARTAPKPAA